MNLSDCKTIEEYRDAAHYWQKRWAKADKEIKETIEMFGGKPETLISKKPLFNFCTGIKSCLDHLQRQ